MALPNIGYFILAVLGYGSAFSLNNIAVTEVHALHVAIARSVIATLCIGLYFFYCKISLPLNIKSLKAYLLLGATTGAIPFWALAWSQQYIASSLGAIIFSTIPLFTLLFSYLLIRSHRFNALELSGALLGIVGVSIAIADGSYIQNNGQILACFATLIAAACYAIGGIYAKQCGFIDTRALTFGQLSFSSILLISIGGFDYHSVPSTIYTTHLYWIIALGIFSTAVPILSTYILIRNIGPANTSLMSFFIPFVAIVIGIIALSEPLTIKLCIGFICVIAGTALILHIKIPFINKPERQLKKPS